VNGDFFERWVNVDWPPEIPNDCTNLVEDSDCIDRNLSTMCPSCWEYNRRMAEYYSGWGLAPSE
jgi:hypothetical protein